jgi:putative mRNA 3-end processing factor
VTQTDLLVPTDRGLYCAAGDFYIDPWSPVPRALVTHAHGDHLTWGCDNYLVASPGKGLAEQRLGGRTVDHVAYGETRAVGSVTVSFHPAGHILGSAQIRIERAGEVWVVSGDYKTTPDMTCAPFELVRAHTFITESTFGLPIYRWPDQDDVRDALLAWQRGNREAGRSSVLLAYPLGKSQRLIGMLSAFDGPIWTHGAVETMTERYREAGVALPPTHSVLDAPPRTDWSAGIVIGPPSVQSSPWLRRFGNASLAFASGWMLVRGTRRRRNVDRGFVLSDHVDWPALMQTIEATGAERVLVTHGFTEVVAQYLTEKGLNAGTIATRWEGERDDVTEDAQTVAEL